MSYNVSYYSFSPSRADEKWDAEGEAKITELFNLHTKAKLSWEEKRLISKQAYDAVAQEMLLLKQGLKDRLLNTSLDYEWEDWSEVEEALTVAERNQLTSLLADYKKRNEEGVEEELKRRPQKRLIKSEILFDIKLADIEFGSIETAQYPGAVFAEASWVENSCLRALCKAESLPMNTILNKTQWLSLYKNLTSEKLNIAAVVISQEMKMTTEESQEYLLQFLTEMKPLIQDFIETNDSQFYIDYQGSANNEPKQVETILNQRKADIFNRFSHLLGQS